MTAVCKGRDRSGRVKARESSDERIRWERKKASVMVKKREQRGKGRQGGREEVSWISGAVLQRDTSAF